MKRLGPELKMPNLKASNLKAPPFLADVYYDIRDRRLLPLVALVVVAIAAVPFLLGGSDEPLPPEMAAEEAAEATRLEIVDGSELNVVEAKPGLRDYRRRLRGRTPTDPFMQRYTGVPREVQLRSSEGAATAPASGSVTEVDESVTEVDETVTPPSEESSPPSSAPPAGKAPGGTPTGSGRPNEPDDLDGKRLFGYRPDIRFGVAGSKDLKLHDDLPLGSLLPKQNAVVLFVGATQSGKRVLFSVAPEVVVRGEGGCVGGAENCRFLSMRAGDAVDLLLGTSGRAYRLNVVSIDFVELEVPPRSHRASGSGTGNARHGLVPGLPQNFSN